MVGRPITDSNHHAVSHGFSVTSTFSNCDSDGSQEDDGTASKLESRGTISMIELFASCVCKHLQQSSFQTVLSECGAS